MQELLKKIKDREVADRAAMLADYRSILEAGDAATPKQVELLRQIMGSLGFDSAKMETDARAIAEHKRLKGVSARIAELDKIYVNDRARHAGLVADSEKEIKRLQEAMTKSQFERDGHERRYHDSRRAGDQLRNLELKNAELFGIPAPEPTPALGCPNARMVLRGE